MTTYNKNNELIVSKKQLDKQQKRANFRRKSQKIGVLVFFTACLLSLVAYGIWSLGQAGGNWIANEFIVVSYDQKLK